MQCSACERTSVIFQAMVFTVFMGAVALLAPALWTRASEVLTATLQDQFPRSLSPAPDSIAGIIVLGGSHARVIEGFRLAREYANVKLLLTGASSEDDAYAEAQGLPRGRLIIEPNAKTTFQNAMFSRRLLRPNRFEKWIIVTSAFHMPRAIGTFRQAGFRVIPWPIFDQSNAAAIPAKRLLHELIGLFVYWVTGRSDSVFPASSLSHASASRILTGQQMILRDSYLNRPVQ